MTRETFDEAMHIDHDITVLKNIKFEQDKNHWVSFNTPSGTESSFWDSTIQNDFKDFIATELAKAQKMLKEL